MNPLYAILLFWAALVLIMALLGYASIKFGVYTTGDKATKPSIEI